MAHNISSVRSENEKQIEAFKQIVALRAHIDTLQRELVDLKRRAIQNISLEMGKTSAEDIKKDKEMMETVEGTVRKTHLFSPFLSSVFLEPRRLKHVAGTHFSCAHDFFF